ncbi:MAG: SulP family inorganic anion transporter [Steroidobacteraceae bacterium]
MTIAAIESARAGLFARAHWGSNVLAGLIVGVVALPLAMAFAIASGVKPEQGIYTAIIAGSVVSLFGGSRLQIAGPTGAFVAILAGVTATHGVDGLLLATLMAGVILILLGFARLGSVIRFIPHPVIVGFTAGIAVIIFVGQWRDFFGLPAVSGNHFHERVWELAQLFPQWHPNTTAIAILSLLLATLAPRIRLLSYVPGPLLAMAVATALQSIYHFEGVATIDSAFGGIPQKLPSLALPILHFARVVELLPSAFAIAMLGAIESLLSAVVADGMAGTQHEPNQELIGQGLANVIAPLFGGFAATGALARTATNVRSGATGPLAGLVHAVFLLIVLLLLAPLAGHIPLASLAAILFVVAFNMSDAPHFARLVSKAPRADVAILLITFALTVFADLVVAVNIGVILAMLQFLRRMSSAVEVRSQDEALPGERLPEGVLVYAIEGPLFFGAVESLERALAQTHTDPRWMIIRLNQVPFMDATGLQTLEQVVKKLARRGVHVLLAEANERVLLKLVRMGIVADTSQSSRHFSTLASALEFSKLTQEPRANPVANTLESGERSNELEP